MPTNAAIGTATERLFKNSIRNHPEVIEQLREYFRVQGQFAHSYLTGTDSGKSDVILRFTDGRSLSANIKAYSAGFNQLTRLSISSFCKEFGLDELKETFEAGALRVAHKQGRFINAEDEAQISEAIGPIAKQIVHFSIAKLENPELFVLFNRKTSTMHLFDMREILENLDYSVTVTPRGVIRIGEFVTIQRKGGNGVKFAHIPKTSLAHPGNQLQVKMTVGAVVGKVPSITSYKV